MLNKDKDVYLDYFDTKLKTEKDTNTLVTSVSKFKLIADVSGTTYKSGDAIDYGYIRTRQEYLYGMFYRKLLTKVATQICCMGDSLTQSQDNVSADKRVVSLDTTRVAGEAMNATNNIASTTYPEALQTNLQFVYGSQVRVINRGYSGDWIKNGYTNYPSKHASDLTLIMYGTNDSRASWVPTDIKGDIDDYINWYEQLIIREILWDKAVIILTPPKLQVAYDVDVRTFSIALSALGDKYGVPVIESTEFTASYGIGIYSDYTHYNVYGYKVFASKVSALFIGLGVKKPMRVNNGETLLTRPDLDNLVYFGTSTFNNTNGTTQSPGETSTTAGIIAQWIGSGSGVVYSFYTEENDMMIFPMYTAATGNVRLTLDFNTTSPQNTNDILVDYSAGILETLSKQVAYTTTVTPTMSDWVKATGDSTQPTILRVAEKGWHTLTIDCTDAGRVDLFGVHFMNYRDFKQERDIRYQSEVPKYSRYGFQTHVNWGLGTTVTSSAVNLTEVLKALSLTLDASSYWKCVPIRLRIMIINVTNSAVDCIVEHSVSFGALGSASGWNISPATIIPIATTPTVSLQKTCSGMTFDPTYKTLTFTWAGNTTISAQCWLMI